MEPLRDDQLIAELQALRPTPRPAFAAELDERAAAGFPRRTRLAQWAGRLPRLPRRRLLVPAAGLAVLAIAVATALVASQDDSSESGLLSLTAPGSVETPAPAPEVQAQGAEDAGGAAAANQASSAAGTETRGTNLSFKPSHRDVERSAAIVLGTQPEDVAGDASRVYEVVHANDGIVLRSGTQEGDEQAEASFELLIPSNKLGEAMSAFSQIDSVRSRQEATADITAPTVTVAELLKESRARIDSLLGQLEEAETESEREAVEAELRHERRHASRLAGRLTHLHRRANFSRVSLQIVSGEDESSGGAWGVDDAVHDAGHILAVAAAVALVALAALGPIALIALLAWLTHRTWIRRQRRRVLS
jgi:uncharacterized protein DUF4349